MTGEVLPEEGRHDGVEPTRVCHQVKEGKCEQLELGTFSCKHLWRPWKKSLRPVTLTRPQCAHCTSIQVLRTGARGQLKQTRPEPSSSQASHLAFTTLPLDPTLLDPFYPLCTLPLLQWVSSKLEPFLFLSFVFLHRIPVCMCAPTTLSPRGARGCGGFSGRPENALSNNRYLKAW